MGSSFSLKIAAYVRRRRNTSFIFEWRRAPCSFGTTTFFLNRSGNILSDLDMANILRTLVTLTTICTFVNLFVESKHLARPGESVGLLGSHLVSRKVAFLVLLFYVLYYSLFKMPVNGDGANKNVEDVLHKLHKVCPGSIAYCTYG